MEANPARVMKTCPAKRKLVRYSTTGELTRSNQEKMGGPT